MIWDITKDIIKRFSSEIIKGLIVVLAVILLIGYVKSCAPWSYNKRLESAVEKQKETIKDLVANNQSETKAVDNEREERKESTERLVTHLEEKKANSDEFKTIVADLEKQYKPAVKPKPKKKAVAAAKPVSSDPIATVEKEDEEALEEAKRSQHNLRVSQEALQKAYEKALQMSDLQI